MSSRTKPPEQDDGVLVASRGTDKLAPAQAKLGPVSSDLAVEAIDDEWSRLDSGDERTEPTANYVSRWSAAGTGTPSQGAALPAVRPSVFPSTAPGPTVRRSEPPPNPALANKMMSQTGTMSWSSAHARGRRESTGHVLEGIALYAKSSGFDQSASPDPATQTGLERTRSEPAPPIDVSERTSGMPPEVVERTPPRRIGLWTTASVVAAVAALWSVMRTPQSIMYSLGSAVDQAAMVGVGEPSGALVAIRKEQQGAHSAPKGSPGPLPPPIVVAAPARSAALHIGPTPSASGSAEESVTVLLDVLPAGASIFRQGKPIGKSPLTVVLAPDERRDYEAVKAGYVTRRVPVDGSRAVVSIRMAKIVQTDSEQSEE